MDIAMEEKKKILNVLQWIFVGFVEVIYAVLLFSTLVTGLFFSAFVTAVLMVFIFPSVFKRIPHFTGKVLVAVIINIFLIMVVAWNLNFDDADDSVESSSVIEETQEEVKLEKEEAPEVSSNPVKEEPTEEVKEPTVEEESEEQEKEVVDGKKQKEEYRNHMDSLSLRDWLSENIQAGINGESYDYDGFKDRATYPVSEVYVEWCNVVEAGITGEYDLTDKSMVEDPELLDNYLKFLESSLNLICEMYPENNVLNKDFRTIMPLDSGREFCDYLFRTHDEYVNSKEIVHSGRMYQPPFATSRELLDHNYTSYYDGNREYNELSQNYSIEWSQFQDFMAPEDEDVRTIRNIILCTDEELEEMGYDETLRVVNPNEEGYSEEGYSEEEYYEE